MVIDFYLVLCSKENELIYVFVGYVWQIGRAKLLTKEEEFTLGVQAQRWMQLEYFKRRLSKRLCRQPTLAVSNYYYYY